MIVPQHDYLPFQPTISQAGQRRFGLSVTEQLACESLRGIVHSYLQVDTQGPTPYPVMPDGTQAIFISPYGSQIGGALTHARDIRILQAGGYFGIRFYPGALRHFFKLDLAEITDQFADSHYFPSRDFGELHSKIYQSTSFKLRAQVCEQWLLQHFQPQSPNRFDEALSLIYRSLGTIRVGQLAQHLGWSTRHLNRLFKLHTGLSTKAFIQIMRLQQAFRIAKQPSHKVQDVVFDLGYYDQSHLIKDFNKRLLSNPSTFFSRFMSDFYNPLD